jgi:hypothetical protein
MFWMYVTFTSCGSIMVLFSLQRLLGLWLHGFPYLERLGDSSALSPDDPLSHTTAGTEQKA